MILKKANSNPSYLMIDTLSEMLEIGYSMDHALLICFDLFKDKHLMDLQNALREGQHIKEAIHALKYEPLFIQCFSFYIHQFSTAVSLKKASELCQQRNELKKQLLQSMIYPLFLILCGVSFSILACFYLQPQFTQFYHSFDISLSFLQQTGMYFLFSLPIVLLICLFIAMLFIFKLSLSFQQLNIIQLQKYMHYPLVNKWMKKYFSIQFCLYYKEFSKLDYDISTSMELMSSTIGNKQLKLIAYDFMNQMKEGQNIKHIIEECLYFDTHFKTTFKVSLISKEKSLLFEQYYTSSLTLVKQGLKKFIATFTAFIYGFIGIYIIGIYVGMIMPMLSMMEKI